MDGILYVIDENSKKRFVQIDLEKYGDLWEDFYDLLVANSREKEATITLKELEKELKAEGLIE
jgi:hypothetical protein